MEAAKSQCILNFSVHAMHCESHVACVHRFALFVLATLVGSKAGAGAQRGSGRAYAAGIITALQATSRADHPNRMDINAHSTMTTETNTRIVNAAPHCLYLQCLWGVGLELGLSGGCASDADIFTGNITR